MCRAQKRLNDKVIAVNNILKRVCELNGLGFIDNTKICAENLFENGLHLNDDGKVILANNFIYFLNMFILMALVRMNESSIISNSSEVKESYPSICDGVAGNPDLRALRKKNLSKLIIAHLKVNSLRNKLEFLKEQIQDNIDILMISETKIYASFPTGQFLLNGYSTPFRLDRNAHEGGILLYVRKILVQNFYLWKKILLKVFLWK